ncbi:hypothetical protein C8Q76DRAFT_461448 [Earliella scabrosa]|nr:hypothetical protein C8Q76DRAFT_461448 [Earliella scabrosa]
MRGEGIYAEVDWEKKRKRAAIGATEGEWQPERADLTLAARWPGPSSTGETPALAFAIGYRAVTCVSCPVSSGSARQPVFADWLPFRALRDFPYDCNLRSPKSESAPRRSTTPATSWALASCKHRHLQLSLPTVVCIAQVFPNIALPILERAHNAPLIIQTRIRRLASTISRGGLFLPRIVFWQRYEMRTPRARYLRHTGSHNAGKSMRTTSWRDSVSLVVVSKLHGGPRRGGTHPCCSIHFRKSGTTDSPHFRSLTYVVSDNSHDGAFCTQFLQDP